MERSGSDGRQEDSPAGFAGVDRDRRGYPTVPAIRQALRAVIDPEIGIDIVGLGLVYNIEVDDGGAAQVRMTLTSLGCPMAELTHQQVVLVLTRLPGITDAHVEFVYSPPWEPHMIEEDARVALRAMGMPV